VICANAIESINTRYRRAIRGARPFPTLQAAMKTSPDNCHAFPDRIGARFPIHGGREAPCAVPKEMESPDMPGRFT